MNCCDSSEVSSFAPNLVERLQVFRGRDKKLKEKKSRKFKFTSLHAMAIIVVVGMIELWLCSSRNCQRKESPKCNNQGEGNYRQISEFITIFSWIIDLVIIQYNIFKLEELITDPVFYSTLISQLTD